MRRIVTKIRLPLQNRNNFIKNSHNIRYIHWIFYVLIRWNSFISNHGQTKILESWMVLRIMQKLMLVTDFYWPNSLQGHLRSHDFLFFETLPWSIDYAMTICHDNETTKIRDNSLINRRYSYARRCIVISCSIYIGL